MSTKIYNGYRLPVMSTQELNRFVLGFKKAAEEAKVDQYEQFIANAIISHIDSLSILGKEKFIQQEIRDIRESMDGEKVFANVNPLRFAYQEIQKRYHDIQETSLRDNAVDLDCELVMIPDEDGIYVLIYAERPAIVELWESTEGVSEFGYWNNVDWPENLSEKEWKDREKKWHSLGVLNTRPCDCGMTISVTKGVPGYLSLDKASIVSKMASFDERLISLARSEAYNVKNDELKQPGNYDWRLHRKITQWLGEEEGKSEIAKQKATLSPQLLQTVTVDDIRLSYEKLYEKMPARS